MIKVLNKALTLIEALAESDDAEGVSELARRLDLDKTTVYRLLTTLRQRGYVEQLSRTEKYRLTLKIWSMGAKLVNRRSLTEAARPVMRELAATVGETVYISVLVGEETVILDKIESPHAIQSLPKAGARMPLHAGSAGKAILAYQPPDLIDAVLGASLRRFTPRTETDRDRLLCQLAEIRAAGHARNEDELRVGIAGVAAPIRTEEGRVTAALAVSGPTAAFPAGRLAEITALVIAAAARISAQLDIA